MLFVPSRWLEGYPVGTMCHAYEARENNETITAELLHRVLGDRRSGPRPTDPIEYVECLLKSLLKSP